MKRLKIALAWLIMVVIPCALLIRLVIVPRRAADQTKQQQEKGKKTVNDTAATSHYSSKLRLRVDGFSGYYATRLPEFARHMADKSVLLELSDDAGNYPERYAALQNGDIDAAVFTIDSYIQTAADFKKKNPDAPMDQVLPGSIVFIIDETKGADAIVGYKAKFPDIDSLNRPDTKFVLTPNSPSETLARVVFGYFNLSYVDRSKCFVPSESSSKVYDVARKADQNAPQVYGVWQPDLSKILQNPNMHVIVDSSRFRGYIVDVMVLSRKYILDHPDLAKSTVVGYLRTQYNERNNLVPIIKSDALSRNEVLSDKQASDTVNGIWWKNTSENMAQMGVVTDTPLQHIEDMIRQIVDMLIKSDAITLDPTDGQPNLLYYPQILKQLKEEGFHPGISSDEEDIRTERKLPILTDEQWANLQKIGTLKVEELVFARGSDALSDDAKSSLDKLAESLKAWPTYYVTIQGNSANDPELALARAKSAEAYLTDKGIERNRCRALAGKPTGTTRVSFVLGQQPF